MTMQEIADEILQKQNEMALYELISSGKIKECGIICGPELKHDLMRVFYKNNIYIPIIGDPYVENDKFYVMMDKELVERMKEILDHEYIYKTNDADSKS